MYIFFQRDRFIVPLQSSATCLSPNLSDILRVSLRSKPLRRAPGTRPPTDAVTALCLSRLSRGDLQTHCLRAESPKVPTISRIGPKATIVRFCSRRCGPSMWHPRTPSKSLATANWLRGDRYASPATTSMPSILSIPMVCTPMPNINSYLSPGKNVVPDFAANRVGSPSEAARLQCASQKPLHRWRAKSACVASSPPSVAPNSPARE